MANALTIGQLSRRAGVPTSTVRYYERQGLVVAAGRSEGNYRQYGEAAVERIRFIRLAQSTGFTLADVKRLLVFRDDQDAPCGDVRVLIESRLDDAADRIVALQRFHRELSELLRLCRKADDDAPCPALEQMVPPTADS